MVSSYTISSKTMDLSVFSQYPFTHSYHHIIIHLAPNTDFQDSFSCIFHSLIFIIFPVSITLIVYSNKSHLESYCIPLCTGPILLFICLYRNWSILIIATLLYTLSGSSNNIHNWMSILAFPIKLSIEYPPIACNTAGSTVGWPKPCITFVLSQWVLSRHFCEIGEFLYIKKTRYMKLMMVMMLIMMIMMMLIMMILWYLLLSTLEKFTKDNVYNCNCFIFKILCIMLIIKY